MAQAQLKYNPGLRGDNELIRSFVVRTSYFELILETLRENTGPANQHVLIVGPRGSGKTTLVRRVAAEIRIDSELNAAWYPLVFAEESYLVSSSGEFWLEALFHLADQTQGDRWERAYRELQEERDEARLRDRALAQLMDFADENGTRLLLIVENLNMLLGEQMANGADWELRHTLLNESRVMLLGTATNRFNEIENIDRAWFELFAIHDLKPLPQEECHVLWESVAGSGLSASKLRPIQILTGGNPRLVKILAEFAVRRSLRELMDHLVQLIDEHTEYFKSHLDGLAPMERKVFVALLDLWDPASAKEVGQAARMDANRVSVHLNRLVQRGAVEVLKKNGRRKIYQVAERLYNIYYLMRRRGHPSSRVRAAVAFMVQFYEERDLVSVTAEIAKEASSLPPEQRQDHYWAYQDIISRATGRRQLIDIINSTATRLGQLMTEMALDHDACKNDIEIPSDVPKEWEKLQRLRRENRHLSDAVKTFNTALFFVIKDYGIKVLDSLESQIDEAASDSSIAPFVTEALITAAAAGRVEEAIQALSASRGGAALEPLLVGLQIFLGEIPRKAQEIMEVGEDVARRIRERRAELSSLAEGCRPKDVYTSGLP